MSNLRQCIDTCSAVISIVQCSAVQHSVVQYGVGMCNEVLSAVQYAIGVA